MLNFYPMSRAEIIILVSIAITVAALALRGAWEVFKDVLHMLMPFLIWIDTVGR